MWTINAKSGSNFDTTEIKVLATLLEGLQISIEELNVPGTEYLGKSITIQVTGAKQTVKIEIIADDGKIIETLSFVASSQGEIKQPWIVPKDTEPGIYTARATDAFDSAETTFQLEQ